MKEQLFTEEQGDYRRTWIWAIPILVVVLFITGQLVILLPLDALGLITRETVETYPTILYPVIGSFAMAAVMFVLWIRKFERRSLASAGLVAGPKVKWFYLNGYGFGLLMGTAVVGSVLLLGGYERETETHLRLVDLAPVLIMMFAFILQSGTEEFVFRGWMMGRIAERFGIIAGVVGNSLLFMLMHLELGGEVTYTVAELVIFNVMTLLFSIFLSLLVIRQRSIWGAAAWHAAWNWMFITWFGLPTTGIELNLVPLVADLQPVASAPAWLSGGIQGPESSVMAIVVLAVGCGVLLVRLRKGSSGPNN